MRLPNFPCPHCGVPTVCGVTDSRANGSGIRRTRECLSCQHRFTTQERAVSGASLDKLAGRHRRHRYEVTAPIRYPQQGYARH